MKHFLTAAAGLLLATSSMHAATQFPSRSDFRDESIYFVMTTRFYDGDTGNNTYCWDGVLNQNDPEWRGDFKGLIEKLDYIKALGFTTVWVTPVVENASGLDYHGYHAFNFEKVDPRYESDDCKFQDLIDAAHAKGMKIILDVVFNHTGNFGENTLCPMFEKDYSQPMDNINKSMKLHPETKLPANYNSLPAKDQYGNRLGLMKNTLGKNQDVHNYWHHYAHFNWDNPTRWWGQIAGDCVDLNTENAYVTNYLVKCYTKFIEMGVDGFRIDTGGHISRLSFNKMFIPQLAAAGEKYKAKRGGTPFYMYTEVCSRAEEVIYRGENYNCSPCFYTWKESKDYPWDMSETSWDDYVVMEGEYGGHVNAQSVLQQGEDYLGHSNMPTSNNAWLNGNDYRAEDYSMNSGLNVIDFPMHWRFKDAKNAFGVNSEDNLYNDARWNVVYVDSHDYGPNGNDKCRFSWGADALAENFSLMFSWRGIPCVYYGTEVEFRAGKTIDEGANMALKDGGRAYFGGYLTGSASVSDFAEYTNATGNFAATLSHPVAMHLQRLNKIRMAIPALRKGQYSTQGCSGYIAFKRRYKDADTDSYALVAISGNATFTGVLNGTYVEVITGETVNVTDGKLSATFSGKGNMRIYVLKNSTHSNIGKIGEDGKYLYANAPAAISTLAYDGNEEAGETVTVRDNGPGPVDPDPVDPVDPKELVRYEGEQCVFFHNTASWGTPINAWVWSETQNYTGGTWPGQSCENLGNGYWKWSYTSEGEIPAGAQVIFNGSGSQTKDLAYQNGAVYAADGTVEQVIPESGENPNPPTPPTPPSGDFVIYFDNTASSWDTPYIHYWGGTTVSTWPGEAMERVAGEDNLWQYVVADGTTGILFNAGDGENTKTPDFVALPGHVYSISGDQGEHNGVSIYPVDSEAPVYFNLQGMPVANPSQGIYIVKRGNKISKEYIY